MKMHKTAIAYAIKYHITLGRLENGFYYVRCTDGALYNHSRNTSAKSAILLMKRFLEVEEYLKNLPFVS